MRGADRVSLSEGCDRKDVPFPVPPPAILCSSEKHPSLFEPFKHPCYKRFRETALGPYQYK